MSHDLKMTTQNDEQPETKVNTMNKTQKKKDSTMEGEGKITLPAKNSESKGLSSRKQGEANMEEIDEMGNINSPILSDSYILITQMVQYDKYTILGTANGIIFVVDSSYFYTPCKGFDSPRSSKANFFLENDKGLEAQ